MKEELQNLLLQNLNELIKSTKGRAGNLIDTLYAQCPDLINQIINYGIASNLFYTLCGIINIVLFIICLINYIKELEKMANDNIYAPLIGIWGVCNIIVVIITITNITNAIQAIIAPKLYLIEYIKNLLN